MEKKKPFYGWVIVAASTIALTMCNGIFGGTSSAFVEPVCSQLGLARGEFTLYRTIISLVGALLLPVYAKMLRKLGVKRVLLIGAAGMVLAQLLYSFANSLWHFYLIACLEGLFTNGISFLSIGIVLNSWFIDKRSTVTGIAYAGTGLGGALFLPLINQVIGRFGWRWGFRCNAAAAAAVLLPVILLLMRDNPQKMGLAPYESPGAERGQKAEPVQAGGVSLGSAKKTAPFWLLLAGIALMSMCCSGPYTHNVAFLTGIGYTAAFASLVTAVYLGFLTIGKVISGGLFDRLGVLRTTLLLCAACAGFPVLALFCRVPALTWLYALLLGLTGSGPSVGISALVRHLFGDRDFAAIFSWVSIASTLGSAAAPPLMGVIYDATGSYTAAWALWLAFAVLTAACLTGALFSAKRREKAEGAKG